MSSQTTKYLEPYTTIQGDKWDGIAFKVYGDEMQMHVLIEANPDKRKIVIFPAGVVLVVPAVDTDAGRVSLPPWARNG